MNLWKGMEGYPTKEDVIYEISSYLAKEGKPNGEFSMQSLNSVFGRNWESTLHGEVVKGMIGRSEIIKTEKSTKEKEWFKIKDNPYY